MNNKRITLRNIVTGETMTFESQKEAAAFFNCPPCRVSETKRFKNRLVAGEWTAWKPWSPPRYNTDLDWDRAYAGPDGTLS